MLLLIVVISVSGSGDDPGQQVADDGDNDAAEPSGEVPEEAPADAEFAGIGEPASDGQFTFTVNSIDCGETIIGEDPFQEQAQGQFCFLEVTVENTGNEARSLSASDQYLYDSQERRFSSDLSYALATDTPIYDQINPGNSMDGTIIFDVPEEATIEFAELHDSAFSNGVLVDLR